MAEGLDLKNLIIAFSILGFLFLIAQIFSNIPTINILGVPITLVGKSLGLHIKFFTLWMSYILIVVLSIYGISQGAIALKKHSQSIIDKVKSVFQI